LDSPDESTNEQKSKESFLNGKSSIRNIGRRFHNNFLQVEHEISSCQVPGANCATSWQQNSVEAGQICQKVQY